MIPRFFPDMLSHFVFETHVRECKQVDGASTAASSSSSSACSPISDDGDDADEGKQQERATWLPGLVDAAYNLHNTASSNGIDNGENSENSTFDEEQEEDDDDEEQEEGVKRIYLDDEALVDVATVKAVALRNHGMVSSSAVFVLSLCLDHSRLSLSLSLSLVDSRKSRKSAWNWRCGAENGSRLELCDPGVSLVAYAQVPALVTHDTRFSCFSSPRIRHDGCAR